jgi:WD40 repeat protein
MRLWEANTGRPLANLEGHTSTVYSVTLSADGRLVATGGEDGTVRLWEANTARPLANLEGTLARSTAWRYLRTLNWSPVAVRTAQCGYGKSTPASGWPLCEATRARSGT